MDDGLQIITEQTSREDLLRHIAALERRLECDRVYVYDPTLKPTVEDPTMTRERRLDPEDRIEMIRTGTDGIGCRDLTISLLEGRHLDPEALPLRKPAARLLQDIIGAAKAVGFADGLRVAWVLAVHYAAVNMAEPPKDSLIATMDKSLDTIEPDARERGALLDRVNAAVERSLSRPGRGRAE